VLQTLYGKAPFFLEWKPLLEEIYFDHAYQTLGEVAWRIIQEIALWYGWKVSLSKEGIPMPVSFPAEAKISSIDLLLRVGLSSESL
jgi:hypothetical protein